MQYCSLVRYLRDTCAILARYILTWNIVPWIKMDQVFNKRITLYCNVLRRSNADMIMRYWIIKYIMCLSLSDLSNEFIATLKVRQNKVSKIQSLIHFSNGNVESPPCLNLVIKLGKNMQSVLAQLERCRNSFVAFLLRMIVSFPVLSTFLFCNNAKELSPAFFLTTCWWLVDFFAFYPTLLFFASAFSNRSICFI